MADSENILQKGLRIAVRAIPSNVRLYASTLTGDRTPVDNSYFPESDIAAMRSAAQAGEARRAKAVAQADWEASQWGAMPKEHVVSQGYMKNPDPNPDAQPFVPTPGSAITASQRAQEAGVKATGLRGRAKTVQYEDYPESAVNNLDTANWYQTAKSSLTDPHFRAASSIGRAVVKPDANGDNILEDTYNWNHGKQARAEGPLGLAKDFVQAIGKPQGLGNMLGNLFLSDDTPTQRPVRINLGKW